MEEGDGSNTGSPVGGVARTEPEPREGQAGPSGWRMGSYYRGSRVMPVEGRSPGSGTTLEGGKAMATGKRLIGPEKVRQLQMVLHAKAKEEPGRRFHALIDKVWREDFLAEAYRRVCRNRGSAGVDGEDFATIESYGVERWLGELARDLRDGTYVPKPVRQVLIPKKQPGKFRPLGIPCIRDRVAQTSALLVLEPIFEADLQPEQYAYRPERSAHDAVNRVHRLLNERHNEVVDCDLSNYFGGNSACRAPKERGPPRQRRTHARAHQGMAGNAGGGRRRRGRQTPHEPGAQGAERDPAGVSDLTRAQQPLYAALHTGLEGAGPCPALPCGDRELCRRPVCAWQGPGGGNAGGGRAAHGGSEAPGQRTENPMPAVPGGASGVSGLPHRTQLSTAPEGGLHRHPTQQGECPKHLPHDQRHDGSRL